jgi:flagellar hook-associated protein 3 FlgL
MAISGYPTILTYSQLSSAIGRLRAQHAEASGELVTGRVADPARELGAGLESALLLKKAIDDIGSIRQTIALGKTRAAGTQASLSVVAKDAAGLSAEILGAVARGDEIAIKIGGASAEQRLRAAFGALNARVADVSLFAGDAVDRPALASADTLLADVGALYAASATAADFEAALDVYFNDPAGGFSQSVYLGGAGDAPRADLGEGESVATAARADEPAIKDVLRALAATAVAAAAPPGAMRDEVLGGASGKMLAGADGVAAIAARIGIAEERMEAREQRLDFENTVLTEAYNGLTARDTYEAASRLQQIEVALEASYTITARLSQLTLSRFIS